MTESTDPDSDEFSCSSDETKNSDSESDDYSTDDNESECSTNDNDSQSEDSSDGEKNTLTDSWNYDVPTRNLQVFHCDSSIPIRNDSHLTPLTAFKLLFTEELFGLVCKQTNM
jgi:hypothetical protein